ncbi:MAG: c-type cytochrome, partial [Gammaproteobacteria bacterium]
YPFVDHDMAHAMIGAIGVLEVRGSSTSSAEAQASAPPPAAATSQVAVVATPAPSGPYHFDAAKGASLYSANCAACHQPTGLGIPGAFPPLKGNAAVLEPDPSKQIDVVLNGLQGQNVGGTVYATPMPQFGKLLNDAEIADIINHERSSWGNKAKQITSSEVKARRAADARGAPPKP